MMKALDLNYEIMNVYAYGYLKETFEEFYQDHVVFVCRFRPADLLPILGQLLLLLCPSE